MQPSEPEKSKPEITKTHEMGSERIKLIAESQGNQLGYTSHSRKTCHLYSLFVDDKYRNQGIGSQLFRAAMKDLHESGCQEARWGAFPDSVVFYQKQGASLAYKHNEFYWTEPNYPVEMKIELSQFK